MAEANKLYSFTLPSPYQAELAKIADQQRLAEVLQAQSQAPIERFSYKGIEARTPATAGLAKLLQGFGGAYFQGQARAQEKALGEKYRAEQMGDMSELISGLNAPAVAGSAAVPETFAAPPTFAVDDEGQPMPGMSAAPAVPAVVARQAGQIDPSMMGRMKTTEGANQVLALVMAQRQAQIEAERRANEPFNLAGDQTRFQPVPGGAPRVIASGVPKTPFAPIDVSKFTPESLVAATNPDGTVDRTKLVAIPERVTGNLAELAAENADRKQKGLPPLSIVQYREQIAKAGRTPAAPRERFVYDAQRGGRVNLDTGELVPVTQGGVPIGSKERPLPTGEVEKITSIDNAFGTQKRLADTFEDKYGGYSLKIGGELANVFGGTFGGDNQAQSEWWASHDANDNVARNALFGASLTAGEQKAWEKTSINPGMSASMIKNRMTERQDLIDAKRKTTINNLDNAGYDVKGFKNTKDFYESSKKPIMKARNPTTGAEITSTDGGNTWQPAGR